MSPSPVSSLEVERYVGACLISNHNHQKTQRERYHQQRIYPGNDQRCGMPLISFVPHRNRQIRPSNREDYNLARLAVHTQGAPLILSKTYNHRKNKLQRNQNLQGKPKNPSNDAVSVTSDESYGSTSSEQCLPRIIKPRKRRKKDRKTPNIFPSSPDEISSSDGNSPEVSNPSRLLTFEFLVPEPNNNNHESECPKLHHSFEDVEDVEESKMATTATTRCQCRYCDPSGQIWDVDKTSFSSFLTPPERKDVFSYPDLSKLTLEDLVPRQGPPNSDLEVSTEIVTSLNGLRDLEIKFFSSGTVEDKVFHRQRNVLV